MAIHSDDSMTRWKSDETQFLVSVQYNEKRGSYVVVPKPILEKLNSPDNLRFSIKNNKVIVSSEN